MLDRWATPTAPLKARIRFRTMSSLFYCLGGWQAIPPRKGRLSPVIVEPPRCIDTESNSPGSTSHPIRSSTSRTLRFQPLAGHLDGVFPLRPQVFAHFNSVCCRRLNGPDRFRVTWSSRKSAIMPLHIQRRYWERRYPHRWPRS